ncbi:response regulator receiver protein [Limibacter armeniacum]|uniref:response regulator receiver protein n=1 Tax=Limibacter armeniacum TaxID=466084 RepID=UPI002FE5804C
MDKVNILAIGRDKEILSIVVRLLNKEEAWVAKGVTTDEEAITMFQQQDFDIVLFGGGISEKSEKKLRALFSHQSPDTSIVQHYGGGSGLLYTEIRQVLDQRKSAYKINIQDNIF